MPLVVSILPPLAPRVMPRVALRVMVPVTRRPFVVEQLRVNWLATAEPGAAPRLPSALICNKPPVMVVMPL